MKKHLIAAAVAAAVAVPAAAQVTVYGILGTGYDSIETKISSGADSAKSKSSSWGTQNLQAGNRLGFRGTEDLGSGLKAGFVFEMHADLIKGTAGREKANAGDTKDGGVNVDQIRQGFVSLSGGFGEVRIGRMNSLSKDVYDGFHTHAGGNFNPGNQGAAIAGILSFADEEIDELNFSTQNYHTIRHSNIVTFISPSMSGLTLRLQYGQDKAEVTDADLITGTDENDTKATVQNIGLSFAAGQFATSYAHDVSKKDETDAADNEKRTTDILGGSFDLGVAKLFFAHTRVKYDFSDGTLKLKDNSVGVSVPMGSVNLFASLSDGDIKGDDATIDTKGYQIGANYNLSKRTMLLARYGDSEAKIDDIKGTREGFAFGVQHSF